MFKDTKIRVDGHTDKRNFSKPISIVEDGRKKGFTGEDDDSDLYFDETEFDFLGLGNKDKVALKKQFKNRYGVKWQQHWNIYKKNGGDKRKLNKSWEQIHKDWEASDLAGKTVVGGILQKGARGLKKFSPAVIMLRLTFLIFIKMNVFNMASMFKLTKVRKPDKYPNLKKKWRQLGGNDKKFDKAVEKGYNKKPIFAKKMNVDFDKKINFLNVEGDKKYLKIPSEIIGTLPGLGTAAGAIVGAASVPIPPATVAPTAAFATTGGIVGGIASTLFGVINSLKIPMGANEGQPEGDSTPPTAEQLANLKSSIDESKKDAEAFSTTTKWTIVVTATLLVAGLSFGIWKLRKIKK